MDSRHYSTRNSNGAPLKISTNISTKHGARRKNLAVAALLAAVIYFAAPTPGCGPFLPDAIFTYALHPDFPLVKYARGNLGIIQPSYARSYLVIAYRNLAGTPLSAAEEQGAVEPLAGSPHIELVSRKVDGANENKDPRMARCAAKIPGVAAVELNVGDPMGITHTASQPYQSYYNCLPDAFAAASSTLQDRIARFGASSTEVKTWLTAQDQVFANCSDRRQIPPQ